MTGDWVGFIRGEQWRSPATLWVEDDLDYSWEQVSRLAGMIEQAIHRHGPGRVARIRSESKLGCFAGQLGAWRAGWLALADDGGLGQAELDRVLPDLTLAVTAGPDCAVQLVDRQDRSLPASRIPPEVVAVNFTSGSTGSRKAVAVTRANLLALAGCRALRVPVSGRLTSGSFATIGYDGWWFDTWFTVAAGGTVVCLPSVNEDVFAWPELTRRYRIDRVLLPAVVVATLVEAVPESLAELGWVFSGGEQFRAATYRQARQAGLTSRFVNLYGPTEATFATHGYQLPEVLSTDTIPIGRPLDGCRQRLIEVADGGYELVVGGELVCLGYLDQGRLVSRFLDEAGQPCYRTGDLVQLAEDENLVFGGRRDSQIKVNGIRVDTAALERQVTGLPGALDCRVVQDRRHTVAFVRADTDRSDEPGVRSRIERVVQGFSPAIEVHLIGRFPTKAGGKVDTTALMDQHCATSKGG